jgi:hypothetical protein
MGNLKIEIVNMQKKREEFKQSHNLDIDSIFFLKLTSIA